MAGTTQPAGNPPTGFAGGQVPIPLPKQISTGGRLALTENSQFWKFWESGFTSIRLIRTG